MAGLPLRLGSGQDEQRPSLASAAPTSRNDCSTIRVRLLRPDPVPRRGLRFPPPRLSYEQRRRPHHPLGHGHPATSSLPGHVAVYLGTYDGTRMQLEAPNSGAYIQISPVGDAETPGPRCVPVLGRCRRLISTGCTPDSQVLAAIMSRPYTKPSNSVAGLSTTGSPSHLVQTHHRIFGDILQTTRSRPGPEESRHGRGRIPHRGAGTFEMARRAAIWTPPNQPRTPETPV